MAPQLLGEGANLSTVSTGKRKGRTGKATIQRWKQDARHLSISYWERKKRNLCRQLTSFEDDKPAKQGKDRGKSSTTKEKHETVEDDSDEKAETGRFLLTPQRGNTRRLDDSCPARLPTILLFTAPPSANLVPAFPMFFAFQPE